MKAIVLRELLSSRASTRRWQLIQAQQKWRPAHSQACNALTTTTFIQPFFHDNPGELVSVNDWTFKPSLSSLSPSVPLISLLHLLWTSASSLFIFKLFIYPTTTLFHVLFGQPPGLAPSTTKSVCFLIHSLWSCRNTGVKMPLMPFTHQVLQTIKFSIILDI